MYLILNEIQTRSNPNKIYVAHHIDNLPAKNVYHTFNFREVERAGTKITTCLPRF
jgi:hypothetical protein